MGRGDIKSKLEKIIGKKAIKQLIEICDEYRIPYESCFNYYYFKVKKQKNPNLQKIAIEAYLWYINTVRGK